MSSSTTSRSCCPRVCASCRTCVRWSVGRRHDPRARARAWHCCASEWMLMLCFVVVVVGLSVGCACSLCAPRNGWNCRVDCLTQQTQHFAQPADLKPPAALQVEASPLTRFREDDEVRLCAHNTREASNALRTQGKHHQPPTNNNNNTNTTARARAHTCACDSFSPGRISSLSCSPLSTYRHVPFCQMHEDASSAGALVGRRGGGGGEFAGGSGGGAGRHHPHPHQHQHQHQHQHHHHRHHHDDEDDDDIRGVSDPQGTFGYEDLQSYVAPPIPPKMKELRSSRTH